MALEYSLKRSVYNMTMEKPLVSVIIPTYKRADSIHKAVNTVLKQTYRPLELLIVDDNGLNTLEQEQTEKVVRNIQERTEEKKVQITYIPLENNCGAPVARNQGALAAQGEYFSFLDDDDEWYPQRINSLLSLLLTDSAASMAYSTVEIRDSSGKVQNYRVPGEPEGIIPRLLARNEIGTTSCALIRRRHFEIISGFDEQLPSRQDLDLWIRLARVGNLQSTSEALTIHHKHNDRITARFSVKNKGRVLFLEKYKEELEANPEAFALFAEDGGKTCRKHRQWKQAYMWYKWSFSQQKRIRVLVKIIRAWIMMISEKGKH